MSEPVIVELQPQPFAFVTLTSSLADMPTVIAQGFGTLSGLFAKAGAPMAGNPMAHCLSFEKRVMSFELGFPVRATDSEKLKTVGLSIGQTPDGPNMTATHLGPYGTLSETYSAMDAAMRARGVSGSKDMWESYMSPPETPPEQVRTDVIWPLVASAGKRA